jgi:peptidoglycan hydrolase CwlO-like protein
MTNKKLNSDNQNNNNIDKHIQLFISYIDQLNQKQSDFYESDNKLNNYINMMQNVIEEYYNFCTEVPSNS